MKPFFDYAGADRRELIENTEPDKALTYFFPSTWSFDQAWGFAWERMPERMAAFDWNKGFTVQFSAI